MSNISRIAHDRSVLGMTDFFPPCRFFTCCVCLCCRGKEPLKDSVVSTYEEHEDSVYAAEWSSADPWLFASLSYDGRLVINRVPRTLKYQILL